jgi:hypothetical protein
MNFNYHETVIRRFARKSRLVRTWKLATIRSVVHLCRLAPIR